MIDKLLSYLGSVKITLEQGFIGVLVAIIGGLLIAFKLQGGQLHKAQVQLLEQQLNKTQADDDQAVLKARDAFSQALQEYRKAGGA